MLTLVLDDDHPGSGLGVLAAVRDEGLKTRVMLLSDLFAPEDVGRALELGVAGVGPRPPKRATWSTTDRRAWTTG